MRRFINISGRELTPTATQTGTGSRRPGRYLLFTEKVLLPREVTGYQSISAVLWDGGDLTELDPERSLALRGWVFQGGTLIVAGGENAERIKQSFLHDILPVEVLGQSSTEPTEDFRRAFGSAPSFGGPILISSARLRQHGRVLVGTTERPLIVEGKYGVGRVVFLAFSLTAPGLRNWDGQKALLAMLFRPTRSRLLSAVTGDSRRWIDGRLKGNLLAELPSPLFILAFLGLYIVLVVPVNYLIFRRYRRLELAWFALPVIAIAFGLIAYNIGYFSQSRTLDTDEITFVEGMAGSPLATAKTFLAIYSPARMNEPIRFPDRPVFSRPLLATDFMARGFGPQRDPSARGRNPLTVTYANGFDVFDFVIHPWAARSLECDYVADLGGQIDAGLTFEGDRLTGTITNHLGYDLNDAALILPSSRLHPFANPMKHGQLNRIELAQIASASPASSKWMFDVLNQGRGKANLPRQYYGPFYPGQPGQMPLFRQAGDVLGQCWFDCEQDRLVPPQSCLLLGWARRPTLQPAIGQGRSQRALTRRLATLVHLIVLPIERGDTPLTVVSEAFWSVEQLGETSQALTQQWNDPLADYVGTTRRWSGVFLLAGGENIFALRPRVDLEGRTIESVTINFELDKKILHQGGVSSLPASAFQVALYDFADGRWGAFRSGKSVECPKDAARFFDPVENEIRLKIEITDPEVGTGARPGRRPQSVNCFLRDVRVNATLGQR